MYGVRVYMCIWLYKAVHVFQSLMMQMEATLSWTCRHFISVSPFSLLIRIVAIKDTRVVWLMLGYVWPCLYTLSYFSYPIKLVWFQTGCYRSPHLGSGLGDMERILPVHCSVCVCHCVIADSETDLLERANVLLHAARICCFLFSE